MSSGSFSSISEFVGISARDESPADDFHCVSDISTDAQMNAWLLNQTPSSNAVDISTFSSLYSKDQADGSPCEFPYVPYTGGESFARLMLVRSQTTRARTTRCGRSTSVSRPSLATSASKHRAAHSSPPGTRPACQRGATSSHRCRAARPPMSEVSPASPCVSARYIDADLVVLGWQLLMGPKSSGSGNKPCRARRRSLCATRWAM